MDGVGAPERGTPTDEQGAPVRADRIGPERDDALRLARAILDRSGADPDDDRALLARQLVRRDEEAIILGKMVATLIDIVGSMIVALAADDKLSPTLARAKEIIERGAAALDAHIPEPPMRGAQPSTLIPDELHAREDKL